MTNNERYGAWLMLAVLLGTSLGVAHGSEPWQIGGQPDVAELERLAAAGFGTVVSTRSSEEMASLAFDEREVVEGLGLRYFHVPVDRERQWLSPARLDAIDEVLATADGPVFLHCRSGYRASVLSAAWLVREEGRSVDAAIESTGFDIDAGEVQAALGGPAPAER